MTSFALCQIPVSSDPRINLDRAVSAIRKAATGGADVAVLPEASLTCFGPKLREAAEPLDGPFVTGLANAARIHGIGVIAGVFEPAPDGRVYNTAVVLDAAGRVAATYRKIHLFDSFGQRESDVVAPGDAVRVAELAGLRVGLVTCYDIRFPELTRALVEAGAEVLVVIAAWGSGVFKEEHWTTLVRARAIENTCWVVAVDQSPGPDSPFGVGRSMLVDPLGVVRADLGPHPGVHVGEIDPEVTREVRALLPSLQHRRLTGLGRETPVSFPG
ncbi:carbon-nitrogen hydrolase family protein [Bailinhaonella thermotolerans]|uniref:Carbon-nitrogen hydrolase family protein n=1 Tax=Bailinhaonella thermotolerans TaxID=1070861 RepID=A0A3A4BAS2_9ACTN|nr:carbon-nitrogen hydrolase family protein [Bailinhaonella thermotolerans]RJL31298.1 carbon-nitrogen hydrolase family protein [Bailinhaonella thermotolerans]